MRWEFFQLQISIHQQNERKNGTQRNSFYNYFAFKQKINSHQELFVKNIMENSAKANDFNLKNAESSETF